VATGLARLGRLPYLGALDPVAGGPAGSPGGNSAYRLAAVWGRFAVDEGIRGAFEGIDEHADGTPSAVGRSPVLLVDDLADSRWTLTVAARALREAGSGPVLPFTLGQR
jgi:ATP-dependent DNA helicase RecQ